MSISSALLPEFDQEMANTRRTLERVSERTFDWRPHEKSYTMKQLASHVANIPSWTEMTLQQDSFTMDTTSNESFTTPQAESTAHLLDMFDANVDSARRAIEATADEEYEKPWAMIVDGKEVFKMPKIAVLRSFIFNHTVHHRAQLTMYFRLNDIPVPALYGPSADEGSM